MTDLNAKALDRRAGQQSPAVAAARKLGVARDRAAPPGARPAPSRSPARTRAAAARPGLAAEPDDIALVLHTSGTTSRPKIVPLTQRNVVRLGPQHRRDAGVHGDGPRPQHHAAVPHPRPDRRHARAASARRAGVLHAGLQRAALLRLDGRGAADLVHGRADHASGDPGRAPQQPRRHRAQSAALHALVVRRRCRRR